MGKPEKPRKCSKWRTKAEAGVIPAPVHAHGWREGVSGGVLGTRAAWGGALSNRDLLYASEEASRGPGREDIAAPNGGPISSHEFFFFNFSNSNILVVVQVLNYFWLFGTPWTAASQASLSFAIFQSLLTLVFIESVMPSRRQNESTSCWNPIMCVWWIQTTENVDDLWVTMHESPQLQLCFCLVIKLQFHWCPLQECILCEQCEKVLGLNWKFALSLQLYDLLYSDPNKLSFWIIYVEEKEFTKNEKKWMSQCRNWKSVPWDHGWAQWNLKTLRPHCRGPAPADPGYSKERRHRRPIYLNIYQRYKE